jgi:protein phosphatase
VVPPAPEAASEAKGEGAPQLDSLPPPPAAPVTGVKSVPVSLTSHEVTAAVVTDVGMVREVNEDRVSFVRPGDPGALKAKGVLAIVADGMGGAVAGEVASQMAVDAISRLYYSADTGPAAALKEAILGANREIFERTQQDESLRGMGTTCAALALVGDVAHVGYVGDSRIYLIRENRIFLMTEDHSFVNEMVKRGLLSKEEARNHEDRNIILRALGSRADVEVSEWSEPFPLRSEDRFVLCSDGLHDLVEAETIKEVILSDPPQAACQKLVQLAKERGGYDNISMVLTAVLPKSEVSGPNTRATRESQAFS